MKTISISLPKTLKRIELHALIDWHIGDSCADFALMQQTIDHILSTPNSFCVLGGYGDVQGYKPSSKINPVIHLDGTTKRAWAEL